jgi:hypothetical protein
VFVQQGDVGTRSEGFGGGSEHRLWRLLNMGRSLAAAW